MGRPRIHPPKRATTVTCSFCGASHRLTQESQQTYGHRAPSGDPCRGSPPIRIVFSNQPPRHDAVGRYDDGGDDDDD
jgi:hypothetical protein